MLRRLTGVDTAAPRARSAIHHPDAMVCFFSDCRYPQAAIASVDKWIQTLAEWAASMQGDAIKRERYPGYEMLLHIKAKCFANLGESGQALQLHKDATRVMFEQITHDKNYAGCFLLHAVVKTMVEFCLSERDRLASGKLGLAFLEESRRGNEVLRAAVAVLRGFLALWNSADGLSASSRRDIKPHAVFNCHRDLVVACSKINNITEEEKCLGCSSIEFCQRASANLGPLAHFQCLNAEEQWWVHMLEHQKALDASKRLRKELEQHGKELFASKEEQEIHSVLVDVNMAGGLDLSSISAFFCSSVCFRLFV
jgi:hypothetical protein